MNPRDQMIVGCIFSLIFFVILFGSVFSTIASAIASINVPSIASIIASIAICAFFSGLTGGIIGNAKTGSYHGRRDRTGLTIGGSACLLVAAIFFVKGINSVFDSTISIYGLVITAVVSLAVVFSLAFAGGTIGDAIGRKIK
jgi:hypothetical protein